MRKAGFFFFHLVSFATLFFLSWTIVLAVQRPSIGITWTYSNGVVYSVDPAHPSADLLRLGDRIIRGDGLTPSALYPLKGKRPGDTVHLILEREGTQLSIDAHVTPSSVRAIASRVITLSVALVFWAAGVLVLSFSHTGKQAVLFFVVAHFAALALGAGTISSFGPPWLKYVFHSGVLWLGLSAFLFHRTFPTRLISRSNMWAIYITSIFTTILSLGYIANDALLNIEGLPAIIWRLTLVVVGTEAILIIVGLARSYRKSTSTLERQQAGIIFLSGLLSLLPFLFLTLIPLWIVHHPLLGLNLSFSSLMILPVGYAYAIFRYRLSGIERTVNRGTSYVFVLLAMVGIFSVWYSISVKFFTTWIAHSPLWMLLSVILFTVLTNRLLKSCQKFVNKVLYGGWYDYRLVLGTVSGSLSRSEMDEKTVCSTLCQSIGSSMQLMVAHLILRDGSIYSYRDRQPIRSHSLEKTQGVRLFSQLSEIAADGQNFIPLNSTVLSIPIDQSPSAIEDIQYAVPLRGDSMKIVAVLLPGRKRDGEGLDTHDLEILKDVTHQAQVTLENNRLLGESRAYSDKIGRLHRQVLSAREEERKTVARDLHDLIIQSLIGMNYRLAETQEKLGAQNNLELEIAQGDLRQIITELRQICSNLRPSSLDVSGITAAIQSKVAEIEQVVSFNIRVLIEGNEEQDIPEEVKICAYRLVQEGLLNVQKHAQADHAEVWVRVTSESISITITDNGQGFVVPESLDSLAQNQHFGLVGMKELIDSVSGTLEIISRPGDGCVLAVQIPYF